MAKALFFESLHGFILALILESLSSAHPDHTAQHLRGHQTQVWRRPFPPSKVYLQGGLARLGSAVDTRYPTDVSLKYTLLPDKVLDPSLTTGKVPISVKPSLASWYCNGRTLQRSIATEYLAVQTLRLRGHDVAP